eukprot:COSAG01_NODE_4850_length_4684_cov_2.069793_6_plen_51_part_00
MCESPLPIVFFFVVVVVVVDAAACGSPTMLDGVAGRAAALDPSEVRLGVR